MNDDPRKTREAEKLVEEIDLQWRHLIKSINNNKEEETKPGGVLSDLKRQIKSVVDRLAFMTSPTSPVAEETTSSKPAPPEVTSPLAGNFFPPPYVTSPTATEKFVPPLVTSPAAREARVVTSRSPCFSCQVQTSESLARNGGKPEKSEVSDEELLERMRRLVAMVTDPRLPDADVGEDRQEEEEEPTSLRELRDVINDVIDDVASPSSAFLPARAERNPAKSLERIRAAPGPDTFTARLEERRNSLGFDDVRRNSLKMDDQRRNSLLSQPQPVTPERASFFDLMRPRDEPDKEEEDFSMGAVRRFFDEKIRGSSDEKEEGGSRDVTKIGESRGSASSLVSTDSLDRDQEDRSGTKPDPTERNGR